MAHLLIYTPEAHTFFFHFHHLRLVSYIHYLAPPIPFGLKKRNYLPQILIDFVLLIISSALDIISFHFLAISSCLYVGF